MEEQDTSYPFLYKCAVCGEVEQYKVTQVDHIYDTDYTIPRPPLLTRIETRCLCGTHAKYESVPLTECMYTHIHNVLQNTYKRR